MLSFASSAAEGSKSGIDLELTGVEGSDFAEEYFYHNRLITDRKVVYIKSATLLKFKHNSRNVARLNGKNYQKIGAHGLDGIQNSGDEGVIRYKVDRDLQWGLRWEDRGVGNTPVIPEFSSPFCFNDLTYAESVPVVGTTGPSPGIPLTNGHRKSYHHRGMLDAVGDEWHSITVADDDWRITQTDTEWRASDGKVFLFVVNPKTPCLTIASTGNAEFYTSPPKTYFIPRIHDQTTFLQANTGTVRFKLRTLDGENIYYRIVAEGNSGGAFTAARTGSIDIDSVKFPEGRSKLQYFYQGNERFTKTRSIFKNPTYPSAREKHGNLLWGSNVEWEKISKRMQREPYRSRVEADRVKRNGQDTWDAKALKGDRFVESNSVSNAFYAKLYGISAKATPSALKSYAQFAKEMLLDNPSSIDSVGHERAHAQTTLPSREIIYRGYWDTNPFYMAFAYDILIDIYRGDRVKGGISAVEDYYIRDCMAKWVHEQLCKKTQWDDYSKADLHKGGMWDTARNCSALICTLAMPDYNSPYYGVSGVNGASATHPWTPFPDQLATWKELLIENSIAPQSYPNLTVRGLGIEEYNATIDGNFSDRGSYMSRALMGKHFFIAANVLALNTNTRLPNFEALALRMSSSGAIGLKDGTAIRYPTIELFNRRFPQIAAAAPANFKMLPAKDPKSERGALEAAGVWGLVWYDDTVLPQHVY